MSWPARAEFGQPVLDMANGKGRITIYLPRPGLVVYRGEGVMTRDLWEPQRALLDEALAATPKIRLFRDAFEVTSVEAAYREASEKHLKENRDRFEEIVFLTSSAVVRMAVNAVTLFSRAPIVAVDEFTFDAKLARALESA